MTRCRLDAAYLLSQQYPVYSVQEDWASCRPFTFNRMGDCRNGWLMNAGSLEKKASIMFLPMASTWVENVAKQGLPKSSAAPLKVICRLMAIKVPVGRTSVAPAIGPSIKPPSRALDVYTAM